MSSRTGRAPIARRMGTLMALGLLVSTGVQASEVEILRVQSEADFRAGTLDGLSISSRGALRLAEKADRVATLEEPFVLDAAAHPEGLVLGTGNEGRVLLVEADGTVRTLYDAEEEQIYAVAADSEGYVYAASSPDGKVYRMRGEQSEIWFDPEQRYIWDLAVEASGDLLVATGTEGKLFRVARDGSSSLVHDDKDLHVRSLLARTDGSALLGTAGDGLVLELRGESVRTLYDAAHPEIVGFTEAPSGSVYVAALASEASLVNLQPQPNGAAAAATTEASTTVTVEEGSTSAGSRRAGFSGARSIVLEISPSGAVDTLWRFEKETLFAIGWFRDRLWVGSGMDGQLYSYRDRQMILEKDLEDRQIIALVAGDPGPVLASTDAGGVYFFSGRSESEGTYTSKPFDTGEPSRFGVLRWAGDVPAGSAVDLEVRSGMSAAPNSTWSDWVSGEPGAEPRELRIADLPAARYVQWRAKLQGSDSPAVRSVELSYRQLNRRPEITALDVMSPGQVLVPANFNASNQVFEPLAPNKEGVFTTLRPARDRKERSKTLFKHGYRTLRWTAADPNKDDLRYRVEFRRGDDAWRTVADELDADHLSFDSSVLPDGRYEFRLTASDVKANSEGEALEADRTTEPVVVDHTAPEVGAITRAGTTVRVPIRDALSPIRRAEVSVDAKSWSPVPAADGLLDGLAETLEVTAPEDAGLVILRVMDAAFNSRTIDLSSVP